MAEVVISEISVEISAVFPTNANLTSWAVICPGNKTTGGKRLSRLTRKANAYLRSALVQAAWGATMKKNSYLSSQYFLLVKRLGLKNALVSVSHSLLVIIYHVSDRDQTYTDLGGDYFDLKYVEQQRDYYIRLLQMLGVKVNIEALPTPA